MHNSRYFLVITLSGAFVINAMEIEKKIPHHGPSLTAAVASALYSADQTKIIVLNRSEGKKENCKYIVPKLRLVAWQKV